MLRMFLNAVNLIMITAVITDCTGLIIPEDLPQSLVAIYGFAPPIRFGDDGRFGFGFRFGNHADFQVLYELGPQTATRPLKVRSASYRQRIVRRRPLLEFLLKTGLFREATYDVQILQDNL